MVHDVYYFKADSNRRVTVSCEILERKIKNEDFEVYVFGPTGKMVTHSTDAGSDTVKISFAVTDSGYYYVAISSREIRQVAGSDPLSQVLSGNLAMVDRLSNAPPACRALHRQTSRKRPARIE